MTDELMTQEEATHALCDVIAFCLRDMRRRAVNNRAAAEDCDVMFSKLRDAEYVLTRVARKQVAA